MLLLLQLILYYTDVKIMKVLLAVLTIMVTSFALKANLSIEGSYQGKNLYVQNPEDEDGFGFCATKVTVNGDVMPGGVSRSAFEVDFSLFNIEVGDAVFIVIEHNDGCTPKILNPEVLLPRSTFVVSTMNLGNTGKLTWSTTGEQGKLPYKVEQFRWNKWVTVGEVDGKGTAGPNEYSFDVPMHSGEVTVRVVQIDHSGTKRKSKEEVKVTSNLPEVVMSPKKVKKGIKFTANGTETETKYEIYDAYGNIVKKGVGAEVDCENLRKGAYYINYDNKNEKFIRG